MALNTDRRTVDLSAFPDLVVIYLGMRANELRGLKTLLRFGPKISKSVAEQPDGLLLHENMIFSLVPPHGGMRQYWRDFESLEGWALAAAQGVVGELRARHGGHGVLVRAVLHARRDGGGLPRHIRAPLRFPELRALRACEGSHVLGQEPLEDGRPG